LDEAEEGEGFFTNALSNKDFVEAYRVEMQNQLKVMDAQDVHQSMFAHELEEILFKIAPQLHDASDLIREYFPQPVLDDVINYKCAIN
jgi:hypothetical protein